MRKLVYYIASSVDGFIAGPQGEIQDYHLDASMAGYLTAHYPETLPTHLHKHLGVEGVAPRRFDTIVMGRATYDPALKENITSPYSHLRQYVVSRSLTESPDPAVTIVHDDPLATVRELKAEEGDKDIYLAGGGQLAGAVMSEIDEFIVKLYPVALGSGIPLLGGAYAPTQLRLTESHALEGGLVLTYVKK